MSLGSIQDIIQSALGKTYSIVDEDLKNIIESQLKLIPSETDERWRIRSNVSPLDLPATASPKEVDGAIRNHLKKEADADDAYFYSGATSADRLRIFEERVENEKNHLTYHIPINKSNGSIQDYTEYDLSGDANGNVVISGHHRGTLNNEELAELDRLKKAINGSVFGRKNVKKHSKMHLMNITKHTINRYFQILALILFRLGTIQLTQKEIVLNILKIVSLLQKAKVERPLMK